MAIYFSGRERQVLRGASEGETAVETGKRLFIAKDTVNMHRKNAKRKLKAKNITHAVYLAIQIGIIE